MTNKKYQLPLLHLAAKMCDAAEVKRLLCEGWDVNSKDNDGGTALHWAAWSGHIETALVLISARADLYARTKDDKTPLDIAEQENGKDSDIVRILREAMEKQGG